MASSATATAPIFGLMAEFSDATSLVEAARRAREEGYQQTDAYSPYPIHELFDALELDDKRVSRFVLLAGIFGMLAGFGLCYWVSVVAYPLNIGGRPLQQLAGVHSGHLRADHPVRLVCRGAGSWILLSGLPLPYHPVFNVPRFTEVASNNGFFLTIESTDPKFDSQRTGAFLKGLGAREINEIPA